MLKKAWRLIKNEDFERVFHKGTPLFFGTIACKILPNTVGHIRLGFSFGKKYVATAVERNTLRRILAEPFSRHLARQSHHPAVDLVFFAIKRTETPRQNSFATIAESVVKYINR